MPATSLVLVLAVLVFAAAAASPPPMTLVNVTADPEAKCLDGTNPVFYIRRPSAAAAGAGGRGGGNDTFIVFLEGGAWCFDLKSCTGRAAGYLGTSKNFPSTHEDIGGLLSADPTINPDFHNAVHVFVHYCDGSSYSSYRPDPVPVSAAVAAAAARDLPADVPPATRAATRGLTQIWMRGRRCLEAVIDNLLHEQGMASASQIIFSGGSAGGLAVYMHADSVAAQVRAAALANGNGSLSFVASPGAGFFLDTPDVHGQYSYRQNYIAADTLWNTTASGGTNSACLAAYPASSDRWKCLFAQYITPHISSDMYIVNSLYDLYQTVNVYGLNCLPAAAHTTKMRVCNASETVQYNAFRQTFQGLAETVFAEAGGAPSAHRGGFFDSCIVHEQNVDYCSTQSLPNCVGWLIYAVNDTQSDHTYTLQQAFSQWYFQRQPAASWGLIDHSIFPANPSCPFGRK